MNTPPVQYARTPDNFDIACFVSGQGPTVVRTPVLWNHISRQWSEDLLGPTYEGLSRYFRLVQYDSRGQGLSTRGVPETVSLTDYMTDLEAVVETLPSHPFVLMGWYYTAKLAIRFAVEHPERVSALVLYDYEDPANHSEALVKIAEENWRFFVETIARIGFPGYPPEKVTQVLFDAMTQSDHLCMAKAFRETPEEELLSEVRAPVLFMASRTGGRPMAGEEVARRWTAALPNARLALFEGDQGLFGPKPEGVENAVDVIRQFLQQQLAAADGTRLDHHMTFHESDAQAVLPTQELGPGGAIDAESKQTDRTLRQQSASLSSRERDVLRLVTQGRSNPQIAEELCISVNTVQNHLKSIYRKIEVTNRAQAAVYTRDHEIA